MNLDAALNVPYIEFTLPTSHPLRSAFISPALSKVWARVATKGVFQVESPPPV